MEPEQMTQKVFKEVMNAFSHPFKVYNIQGTDADTLLKNLCCVFLDNTVSFYVYGNEKLSGEIKELTYARAEELDTAGFVILPDPAGFDMWEKICAGSLVSPHKGATIIVYVPEINGAVSVMAEGPGIDGKESFLINKALYEYVSRRAELDIEYPRGFELLFVTPRGDICAVPRHVTTRRENN